MAIQDGATIGAPDDPNPPLVWPRVVAYVPVVVFTVGLVVVLGIADRLARLVRRCWI